MTKTGSQYGPFESDGIGDLRLGTHDLGVRLDREVVQISVGEQPAHYKKLPEARLIVHRGVGSIMIRRLDNAPLQVALTMADDVIYGDRAGERDHKVFAEPIPLLSLEHVRDDLWQVDDDEVRILGKNRLEMFTSTVALFGVIKQIQAQQSNTGSRYR